jgi:hypothetical protein
MRSRRFTRSDADTIRSLLLELRRSERSEQKKIRHRLRSELGFYISDWTQDRRGFTAADFDLLIKNDSIEVLEP